MTAFHQQSRSFRSSLNGKGEAAIPSGLPRGIGEQGYIGQCVHAGADEAAMQPYHLYDVFPVAKLDIVRHPMFEVVSVNQGASGTLL